MTDINKDTMFKDLISEYPWFREALPEINPKVKILNSPLGKVMINRVSIANISQKSGVPVDEWVVILKNLIEKAK